MAKKRFYDITLTIKNDMIAWPSDGPVKIDRVRSMDDGERLNQSHLDMSAHTGTHIDAPVHFIKEAGGVDMLSLELLIGPAFVVNLSGIQAVTARDLEGIDIPNGTERLLLKTNNSDLLNQREFYKEFCYITLDGARYLIDTGVKVVGIDYLSVAKYGSGEAVHQALLGARIVIIEGLDLREVKAGLYNMTALPLKIAGCDGAPARVVLEEI